MAPGVMGEGGDGWTGCPSSQDVTGGLFIFTLTFISGGKDQGRAARGPGKLSWCDFIAFISLGFVPCVS